MGAVSPTHVNFCSLNRLFIVISFLLGLIHLLMVICGSFKLWINEALYYSFTNFFCLKIVFFN